MKISMLLLVSLVTCLQVAYSDNECRLILRTSGNTVITNEQLPNPDCTRALILWRYEFGRHGIGRDNLTIIFSSSQHESFEFCLLEPNQIYKDIPVYRVVDQQETLVVKSEEKLCMPSDTKTNILTLKLVGPQRMHYYGVFIDYSINN